MPSPYELAIHFQIKKESQIYQWYVTESKVTHVPTCAFQQYRFDITLTVIEYRDRHESTVDKPILELLNEHTSEPKTIYSQYGNPYRCFIEPWKLVEKLNTWDKRLGYVVSSTGWADRV